MNRPTHRRGHRLDGPDVTVETRDRQSSLRSGFTAFSTQIAGRPLHAYQLEAANAILASIEGEMGETFVVMVARQMGKNELSAQLEAWLLDQASETGGTIVKAAPTFRPQLHTSLARLSGVLRHPRYDEKVKRAHGYRLAIGNAESIFLSTSPTAHAAGATASLLLAIEEGQDVNFDKYTRDFRPMAAPANATTVIYGTASTPDTVVESQREGNEARPTTPSTDGSWRARLNGLARGIPSSEPGTCFKHSTATRASSHPGPDFSFADPTPGSRTRRPLMTKSPTPQG